MNEIMQMIESYGMSIVLMAYFLLKDWKWSANITNVLGEMKEVLIVMRDRLKGGESTPSSKDVNEK